MIGIEGQIFNDEQKKIKADLVMHLLEKFIWHINKAKDKFSPQELFDLVSTVLIMLTSEIVLEVSSRFIPPEAYNEYLDFINKAVKERTIRESSTPLQH